MGGLLLLRLGIEDWVKLTLGSKGQEVNPLFMVPRFRKEGGGRQIRGQVIPIPLSKE